MELQYALLFLGFLASLTGVIGDTLDKTQAGLKRILPLGWAAISIVLLSFLVGGALIYQKDEKAKIIQAELVRRQDIALEELLFAFEKLFFGVNVLYQRHHSGFPCYPSLEDLKSERFISDLKSFDLLQENRHPGTLFTKKTYGEAIEELNLQALNDFKSLLSILRQDLPTNIYDIAQNLTNMQAVKAIYREKTEQALAVRKIDIEKGEDPYTLNYLNVNWPERIYPEFIDMSIKLRSAITANNKLKGKQHSCSP